MPFFLRYPISWLARSDRDFFSIQGPYRRKLVPAKLDQTEKTTLFFVLI
jgi:hypothetical protein